LGLQGLAGLAHVRPQAAEEALALLAALGLGGGGGRTRAVQQEEVVPVSGHRFGQDRRGMAPEVRRIPADSPDALRLVADMVAELVPVYGDVDEPGTPSAKPQDFSPPGGAFLALYEDGRPVAG